MGSRSHLEAENQVLRSENSALRAEVAQLKKSLAHIAAAAGASGAAKPRQPFDPARRERQRLIAIGARCHTKTLGDKARREALNRAYRLGALQPVINEPELEWKQGDLAIDPTVDPVRAKTISGGVGALFDLSDVEYNFWLMSRLARFSPDWEHRKKVIFPVWKALQTRVGGGNEKFYYGDHTPAADDTRAWFPNSFPAVMNDALMYDDSLPMRRDGRWHAPQSNEVGSRVVFDEGEEDLPSSKLFVDAKRRSRKRTDIAMQKSEVHSHQVQTLALMEIAYR